MSNQRHIARKSKAQSQAFPLDVQCWLLAVASVLCTGDHPRSLSALGALRRALTQGSRADVAKSLSVMLEVAEGSLCEGVIRALKLLLAEAKHGTPRRIGRLAMDVVHLSLSGEKNAC